MKRCLNTNATRSIEITCNSVILLLSAKRELKLTIRLKQLFGREVKPQCLIPNDSSSTWLHTSCGTVSSFAFRIHSRFIGLTSRKNKFIASVKLSLRLFWQSTVSSVERINILQSQPSGQDHRKLVRRRRQNMEQHAGDCAA